MIIIDNIEYKVNNAYVQLVEERRWKSHDIVEYTLCVVIEKFYNNDKGLISFYVDHIKDMDIKYYENKKYNIIPTDDDTINCVEIATGYSFVDMVDGEIKLEFGKIKNNKIPLKIDINDDLVKLKFDGLFNINE